MTNEVELRLDEKSLAVKYNPIDDCEISSSQSQKRTLIELSSLSKFRATILVVEGLGIISLDTTN